MADTKTSLEAAATALDGTEIIRGVQAGGNVKLTVNQIATKVLAGAVSSVNTRTGAVALTATDVGLANVNNTADASKPVSAAQAAADSAVATNASTALTAHTSNIANPHAVTPAQIGAPTGSGNSTGTNTGDQTNIAGNAATVTTNANLTGDITSVGNATTLTNAPVIAKVLTGYVSGAGIVAATDSILAAIQKVNGNDALKAPLASPTFTGTVGLPAGQVVNGVTLTAAGLATNYLTAAGTYAAVAGGGSGLPTDGSGTMTGAISSTVGTLTSTVANGATAKGFALNTPAYTTAGAKLLSLQNTGVEKFAVTKDGAIIVPITATNAMVIGSGTASTDSAIWADLTNFYFLNGNNTSVRSLYAGDYIATRSVTFTNGGALFNNNGGVGVLNSASSAYMNLTASRVFVTGATLTPDVAFDRNAAGVGEINSGTAGAFRDLKLRNLLVDNVVNLKVFTVATLPSAVTSGAGSVAYVTDASAAAYNTIVASGGAVKITVASDGTNWKT